MIIEIPYPSYATIAMLFQTHTSQSIRQHYFRTTNTTPKPISANKGETRVLIKEDGITFAVSAYICTCISVAYLYFPIHVPSAPTNIN